MNQNPKKYYLLLIGLTYAISNFAQASLTITKSMFNQNEQLILDNSENWLFKVGNNPAWAAEVLDISDWQKFKPTELSIANADETGRAEGWFRIKIKIDPSLKNQPLYFNKRTRDAANVYLNGQLMKSYGKMAPNRKTYDGSIDNGLLPNPISLQPDSVYSIAIHILDYTVMYPPRLASSISGPHIFFEIVGIKYFTEQEAYWQNDAIIKTLSLTASGLLSLFFWLLVFLNPDEKSLRSIAIAITFGVLVALGRIFYEFVGISFTQWRIYFSAFLFATFAYITYLPRVISQIFTGTITRRLKYITAGMFIVGCLNVIITLHIVPMVVIVILSFSLSLFLVIKYWTTLKGAQWAFVVGILSTTFLFMSLVILAFLRDYHQIGVPIQIDNVISTGGFLALPLSMLVYTSLRFKEINKEVQLNAKEVVRVSEEKAVQLQKINTASAKFVPSTFLNFLGKENILDATLGDYVEKQVSVLFSDIRDYTTLSEQMTPEENFRFVNAFNRRMGPIIQQHQGFVNQYLGDGLMAIFPENTEDTLKAAIVMQQTLLDYNQNRIAKNKIPLRLGIGIHAGPLIMGIIGDDQRMDAATISDTVNAASRVEGLTKHFGANILLSESVLAQLPKRNLFNLRYLGLVQVKGKQEVIKIYECFDGDESSIIELKKQTIADFKKGLHAYFNKNFELALSTFKNVKTKNTSDKTVDLFISKTTSFLENGVPKNWTGIESISTK